MKLIIFGSGSIGQAIIHEARSRGHQVTVVTRRLDTYQGSRDGVQVVQGDATDPASVATVAAGHDLVISAIGPGQNNPPEILVKASRGLTAGAKQAGVKRLLVVGGAGSLQTAPGKLLLDAPDFPPSWRPTTVAHRDALQVYRKADLDRTFLSPANLVLPGKRTGKYRTDLEQPVVDADGKSAINIPDLAVAVLDEVEKPAHIRQRFTIGY